MNVNNRCIYTTPTSQDKYRGASPLRRLVRSRKIKPDMLNKLKDTLSNSNLNKRASCNAAQRVKKKRRFYVETQQKTYFTFEQLINSIQEKDRALQCIDLRRFASMLTTDQLKGLLEAIKINKNISHIEWWGNDCKDKQIASAIENAIIDNNVHYRYYPSDFQLLLLSYFMSTYKEKLEKHAQVLFYKNKDNKYNKFIEGWEVQDIFYNRDSKSYAVLYKKDNQVVLSIRGLNVCMKEVFANNSTILTTLKGAVQRKLVPGHLDTFDFAEKLASFAYDGYDITVSGYSLGGWMAKLCAFYCQDYFGVQNVRTVSFDSPGIGDQVARKSSVIGPKKESIQYMDSVSYVAVPNIVNCANRHIGKLYRLFPSLREYDHFEKLISEKHDIGKPEWGLESVAFTQQVHDLRAIVRAFDSDTGCPKCYECMREWPMLFYDQRTIEKVNREQETQELFKVSAYETGISTYLYFKSKIVTHVYPQQMLKSLSYMDSKDRYRIKKDLSLRENFELCYVARYAPFSKRLDNYLNKDIVGPELYMIKIKQINPDHTILGRQLKIIESKYSIEIFQGRQYAIMKSGENFRHVKYHIMRLMLNPSFHELITKVGA